MTGRHFIVRLHKTLHTKHKGTVPVSPRRIVPTLKSRTALHAITPAQKITYLSLTVFNCYLITQGAMPQAWWNQVHDQRFPLLQLGSDLQRRGRRRYRAREREGFENRMVEHEP